MNKNSLFYPAPLIEKAQKNIAQYTWAKDIQDQIVQDAQPWMRFSDDDLWGLMFGNTLKRSWMVWSNGHCPVCKTSVPMYNWEIDALTRPWKVRCPHCAEIFPKNDFYAYYQSGLDEHHIFDGALADRSLLFNVEHPDPSQPAHLFGVDDGDGFRADDHIWWFVATYLIYGQWKQVVQKGICKLANAYTVTGDHVYAHKAGIMLDRVADLYPTFDFKEEGVLYEKPAAAGYVSTWHDACEEVRELILAYDQIREVISEDEDLATFLQKKSEQHQIGVSKSHPEDVMHNIETRILGETLVNYDKIRSNYPRQEIALIVCHTVLEWPENRDAVMGLIDEMVETATAVDGVTGEKGLAGYSSGVIQSLAQFLELFGRVDPHFLDEMLQRHPKLSQTYRFHIDTMCLQNYYPRIGDTGGFAQKTEQYVGVSFSKNAGLLPSMYSFLWRLYERTGDVGYVQALYRANGYGVDGLPFDLFAEDCEGFRKSVQEIIAKEGLEFHNVSVNKEGWHLALLRSGQGGDERVVWLDYDTGGRHGHLDALNMGLFAKGLDLMPDFGYPPVHMGGWEGDLFNWYLNTPAHNTVVVDGQNQKKPIDGVTKLWAVGDCLRAIQASCEAVYDVARYERTVVMVDVSDTDSYVLDVFQVAGGRDHAKFMHSHFGEVTTHGLDLQAGDDYGYQTQMRNFRCDLSPKTGWWVDWLAEDRLGYLDAGRAVHVRYTDLTTQAEAHIAEGWVAMGFNNDNVAWIPRLMVRRQSEDANLVSTFVGVCEPYEGSSQIASITRLPLVKENGDRCPDTYVAVEVQLVDGRCDLLIVSDRDDLQDVSDVVIQEAWGVRLAGELGWVRKRVDGTVERVLLHGKALRVDQVDLSGETGVTELFLERE
jgi:hypothetical protein